MDDQQCLRMIMVYLKDRGLVESYLALEKESNVQCEVRSRQVQFFRKIILDGDFKEAISFLQPFEVKLSESDFKAIIMSIHRQRLFELVENPDEVELRELLQKDIVGWCNEDEYKELFQCLTLKTMKELPEFENWTVQKGRVDCFQIIKPFISMIESQTPRRADTIPSLQAILEGYRKKDGGNMYRHGQLTLNPLQEQVIRQESRLDSQIINHSNVEETSKKPILDDRFLNPRTNDYEQLYSNKFPSRVVSQKVSEKDDFTFSEGKRVEQNYKMKLLSTVLDDRAIRVCQFSQDGKHLAIGTNSSCLRIYNVEDIFQDCRPRSDLEMVYEIQGLHSKSIFSLDWTYNKRLMVTCSNDATVKLTKFNAFKSHETSTLGKHQGCIRMVRFDPVTNKVASCAEDGLIKIWDTQKARSFLVMKGHQSSVNGVKISQSSLFSVSKDCTLRMWDFRTGESEGVCKLGDSQLTYIARGTEDIVVSHKNGCLSFCNSSLQQTNVVKVHQDEIRSVEGLMEQNLLITSSFDGNVCVLKVMGDRITKQYHQHNSIKDQDKVVHAVFNRNLGFASSSNMGVCNIFAMI